MSNRQLAFWSFIAILLAGLVCYVAPKPEQIRCCVEDADVETEFEQEEQLTAGKRRVHGIWFAGGAPAGLTESDFQRRVMAALKSLSEFTNTDFVQLTSKAGSKTQVYVATNEMMWQKYPSIKPLVPLGLQNGTWVYFTVRNRFSVDGVLEGCTLHEFGHRFGLRHSTDRTSIMHPDLPVFKLSESDKLLYQKKLGKPQ